MKPLIPGTKIREETLKASYIVLSKLPNGGPDLTVLGFLPSLGDGKVAGVRTRSEMSSFAVSNPDVSDLQTVWLG